MSPVPRRANADRTRRRAFSSWLAAQVDRDDAVGGLARMAKADTGRSGLPGDAYLARLQQAETLDGPTREALFEAIVEWGASES